MGRRKQISSGRQLITILQNLIELLLEEKKEYNNVFIILLLLLFVSWPEFFIIHMKAR